MFSKSQPTDEVESPLDATARQYARAGWWITSRLSDSIRMEKRQQQVILSVTADGKVIIDGPALSPFETSGRQRAWMVLGAVLLISLVIARLLGWI